MVAKSELAEEVKDVVYLSEDVEEIENEVEEKESEYGEVEVVV